MAPDQEMGIEVIRAHLKNCIASLKAETGAQDFPLGERLRLNSHKLMRAQDSIEHALKQLDQGDKDAMLRHIQDGISNLPVNDQAASE
jgi:hypothetical protein